MELKGSLHVLCLIEIVVQQYLWVCFGLNTEKTIFFASVFLMCLLLILKVKKTTLFSRQYFECWITKELPCPTWSGSSRQKKTTLFSRQNFESWITIRSCPVLPDLGSLVQKRRHYFRAKILNVGITKELPCPTWSGSSRPPKKTTLFSRQNFECWITIRNCPVLPGSRFSSKKDDIIFAPKFWMLDH